jgi:Domain of unknown function (DUF4936)
MLGYYIYYKVDAAQRDVTRTAARALLAEIARLTGVTGRLMARTDDALTWMEVYEPIVDRAAFDRALSAAVEQVGITALLIGGHRITERFESI